MFLFFVYDKSRERELRNMDDRTKKIVSIVLIGVAAICLSLVVFLGVRQWLDDRYCQEALDELRNAAESKKEDSASVIPTAQIGRAHV